MDSKKRKREPKEEKENNVDTSKPTALFYPKEGRAYTLSVAIPGSIVKNAQTPELQTQLAGQIARALAVFCVDEVVVFEDGQVESQNNGSKEDSYTGYSDPNYFLTHVLSYLETPPCLRKALFPMHPDLRLAGALPSLDMPHHLRRDEWCQYREGYSVPLKEKTTGGRPHRSKNGQTKPKGVTLIQTGLPSVVFIPDIVPTNTRVTVNFKDQIWSSGEIPPEIKATAVAPSAPREEAGYYWGYSTRSAASLSMVLTECPFDGGYDLTIGTSERGVSFSELTSNEQAIPQFRHMMIVFGGVAGLEVAVSADAELQHLGVTSPKALFDHWVNLCPGQGSRTIRTEEAVWLGLMGLRDLVLKKGKC